MGGAMLNNFYGRKVLKCEHEQTVCCATRVHITASLKIYSGWKSEEKPNWPSLLTNSYDWLTGQKLSDLKQSWRYLKKYVTTHNHLPLPLTKIT